MDYLIWVGVGAAAGLVLFFLLTRGKAREVEGVMHQFGSNDQRAAWRKPSASVWDESQSNPDAKPEDAEPPERS